jgi:hypothetical protein
MSASRAEIPAPGTADAPSFGGNPAELASYLKRLDWYGNMNKWDDAVQITTAIEYISSEPIRCIWEKVAQKLPAEGTTWAAMKAKIRAKYPGAEVEKRASWEDLEKLVREAKISEFRT